jgi:hypothetical protein
MCASLKFATQNEMKWNEMKWNEFHEAQMIKA